MAGKRVVLAITLLCEAESEGIECQRWIIWSIHNRKISGRWKKTEEGCCMQRFQYSEFNDDKPDNDNLERVLQMDESDARWQSALALVDTVLQEIATGVPDPTNGSTHFFADYITPPGWSGPPAVFRGQQGKVRFYSDVP